MFTLGTIRGGVRGQQKALDDDHAPKSEDIELQKSQSKIGEGDIDEPVVWSPKLDPRHSVDHAGYRHGNKRGDKQKTSQGFVCAINYPGQKHGAANAYGRGANREKSAVVPITSQVFGSCTIRI